MQDLSREVNRYLTLLRNKMRDKGFSQLEVQDALGWGRSYLSQLMTRQKKLRVDQVLAVLDVIGVTPAEFFAELYWHAGVPPAVSPLPASAPIPTDFAETRAMTQGLVKLLLARRIITPEDLAAATRVGEVTPTSDSTPDSHEASLL